MTDIAKSAAKVLAPIVIDEEAKHLKNGYTNQQFQQGKEKLEVEVKYW